MFLQVSLRLCNRRTLLFQCNNCRDKNALVRQLSSIMTQPEFCFKGQLNRHNAVEVNSREEPCEANEFGRRLAASLKEWTKLKRDAVWFEVDAEQAEWIPVLVRERFKFHHAKENKLTLYKWLSEDADCNIPHYAHTNIGVGAFVYNSGTEELLVVKEKRGLHNMWKLPGGYMDPDEDISEAVQREVLEETGVKTKFKSIIGFRHTHQHVFGCSDMYFFVHLEPESFSIKKCSQEISECVWMKLEEYSKHPEVHENNKFAALKMIEHLETGCGIEATNAIHPITKKPIVVYTIGNNTS